MVALFNEIIMENYLHLRYDRSMHSSKSISPCRNFWPKAVEYKDSTARDRNYERFLMRAAIDMVNTNVHFDF